MTGPKYISNFIAKYNPDLIVPGGTLAGNMYFKKKEVQEESDSPEEGEMN